MSRAVVHGGRGDRLPPAVGDVAGDGVGQRRAHEILFGRTRRHGDRARSWGDTVTALAGGEGVRARRQPRQRVSPGAVRECAVSCAIRNGDRGDRIAAATGYLAGDG